MGQLLIVTGPPGAGKSSVVSQLAAQRPPGALVRGDEFFGFLGPDRLDPWLVEAATEAEVVADAAAAATGQFVLAGYPTLYDGVVHPTFLRRFMASARLSRVHYVVLLPSADICVDRVGARTVHGFTDEKATRRMHAEFSTAELARSNVISDPSSDVHEVAMIVFDRLDKDQLVIET